MKRILLGTTALALAISTGGFACAQGYAQVADASDIRSDKIETVTVTAERRAESAQNVGIALSVLSDKALSTRGIDTVNGLQAVVPSFEVVPAFGSGQPEFRLRGVGFDDYGANNSSTVGVYIDDVVYPVPATTQGLLYDVSRVEVLRGPQGTLYGRNTTGGAVNFVTNLPSDVFSAGISADYSSHGEFKGEGYVSGPIADGLAFRLSAVTKQGGAWQKNRDTGESLGDKDASAFRAQLQWTPTDKVSFRLVGDWGYDKSEDRGLYLFDDNAGLGLSADTSRFKTGWGASQVFADFVGLKTDAKPAKNSVDQSVALHSDVDIGFADLTAITAYQHHRLREYADWDASSQADAGAYYDNNASVFSQEIRLASKTAGPLSWIVGLYYANEKLTGQFNSDFIGLGWGFVSDTVYDQYVNSIAAFAQVEYAFSDQWKLIGGLRLEDEARKLKNYDTKVVTPASNNQAVEFSSVSGPSNITSKNSPITGKVELEYTPADGVLLYAGVSRGVKSGGFTVYNVPNTSVIPAFKPESLWAYEGGFKTSLLDDTLELNGAVFYYDYHNQQVQSGIYDAVYGAIGTIVNANRSHIVGGEIEAQWRPIEGLLLTQTVGYKQGTFDSYDNNMDLNASAAAGHAVYIDAKGKHPGFPPLSYAGSVSYQIRLDGFVVEPQFDYSYRDKRKPLFLGPTYDIDSYWLANASLTVSPDDGPWAVTLYGRNIFDRKYDLERNFFISGINVASPGDPATIGIRLRYTY